MSEYRYGNRRGLYRARDGVFLGVCKGFADHLNLRVGWIRFFVIITALLTRAAPMVALYLIAAFLMRRGRGPSHESKKTRTQHRDCDRSFKGMAGRLKRRFENMEARLRRMEDAVTSREFEWDRKMKT